MLRQGENDSRLMGKVNADWYINICRKIMWENINRYDIWISLIDVLIFVQEVCWIERVIL